MELSDFLRGNNRKNLYKTRTREVGTLNNRREKAVENRKQIRNKMALNNRNIDVNMSPVTPAPPKKAQFTEKEEAGSRYMLEKLARWKEQRKKLQDMQKKDAKPAFKVCHVPVEIGLPNLELINKQIKGKVFTGQHNATMARSQSLQKDLHQITQTLGRMGTTKVTRANTNIGITKASLRTRKPSVVIEKAPKKTPKKAKTEIKVTELKEPLKTTPAQETTSKSTSLPRTPLNECTANAPVYVSPFVTVARGKQNARAEFELRQGRGDKSLIGHVVSEETLRNSSPQAGANFFEHKLNEEIERLDAICVRWEEIRAGDEVPLDANDMIDVAIGQTRLLISQKFEQFRKLINECRASQGTEMPVKNEDLHGFWDMIYIQVDQLGARFENLERIKSNNWVEIMSAKKAVPKKALNSRASKAKASSKLKEMIQARRKKMTEEEPVSTSPSVTMMNLARSIKRNNGLTPGRSILKLESGKTPKSVRKNVLFKNDDDKENENIVTPRRSLRLVRKSLQNEL